MKPPLASDLIKSNSSKRPQWLRDAEERNEMKVCHFSAMIALLNLAIMTPGRRVAPAAAAAAAANVSKVGRKGGKRNSNPSPLCRFLELT